jgi:hypothetical protein
MLKLIMSVVIFAAGVYTGALWSETHPPTNAAVSAKDSAVKTTEKVVSRGYDVVKAGVKAGTQAAKQP